MNTDRKKNKNSRRLSGQSFFLGAVVVVCCLVIAYLTVFCRSGSNGNAEAAQSQLRLEDIPFNGARAYEYLKRICAIGPRPSGSAGMKAQQEMLTGHFRNLGGQVDLQSFTASHPLDRSAVPMANLIVQWHPERKERILLCAHYDTLPFPMLDPRNPRGVFVGANDGASGVAVLMELANDMPSLDLPYGVDFVLFDAEEFIFNPRGHYFLGSEHFARSYSQARAKGNLPYEYRWGVLLDMVGDANLQIYHERYSVWWPDTRPLVEDIWSTAGRLGVHEFIPRKKHAVRDDHLALHEVGIPTCDIIDFDYPPWHTQGDTPDKCSALSLAKVGWVLREWLKAVEYSQ